MLRSLLVAFAALLVSAPAWAKAPRLTVFISVDAMGSDVLLRNRPNLKSGLHQAMTQGAFFPYARYDFAEAVTACGHATLVTGANPWRHGVVSNRVFNRQSGASEPIFHDADHPALEAPAGMDDVSPLNLRAETLSDRLRLSTNLKGKSVAISAKGRASVAMAGKLGQAWWFNSSVGKFITGTWYSKEFPAWVKAFNDKKTVDNWFGKQWTLSLPAKAYSEEDDRPWESDWYGLGKTFPHPLTGGLSAPGPEYYKAIGSSPMVNDLIVQMSRAAIEGEQLGKDDVPDLLSVSFSGSDMVFHLFGPHSWEMQDVMVKLDRQIGELISAAEKAAGKGNVLVVISADHGGAAIPEWWTAAGLPASRIHPDKLKAGLSAELKKRFGAELVVGIEELDVYLNDGVLTNKKLDGPTVRRAAAEWMAKQPEVAFAVARDDLYSLDDRAGFLKALQTGYFPGRSGDVLFVMGQYQVLSDEATGTNHGTPYAYDAMVPVILYGRGVRSGTYRQQIGTIDVAPTVAALLQMMPPSMAEGAPRAEALNGK